MSQCYKLGDFKKYFNENMKALGAPVPTTLFDSYQTVIGTVTLLVSTLHTLGKGATMAELVGATMGVEKLMVAAAFEATAYTGFVIGSIAVASGRSLNCGARISDMFVFTYQNKLLFEGWHAFYALNPDVLESTKPNIKSFDIRVKHSPIIFEYA